MAVRGLVAGALAALALAAPAGAQRVAYLHRGYLVVVDLRTSTERVVERHAGFGAVRWSGDGRRLSVGGRVVGGPSLPGSQLAWRPTGESAAYVTARGGVGVWTAGGGTRTVVPDGWGARSLAWGRTGLAIGRAVCHVPCGIPTHREVWLWDGRALRRLVRLPNTAGMPMPFAWDGRGRVLWWLWPDSGSIAADGVRLYAGARPIASMLMYPDWTAPCGAHLALAVGGDRDSRHGKSIVLDGRDVSRDPSRSWVSPSCGAEGSPLVASAAPDDASNRFGREHRAIWQLLPTRRQLTHPPRAWTDEAPHVLADGSVLFVRTRQSSRKVAGAWIVTERGTLERLARGRLTRVADVSFSTNAVGERGYSTQYYGHYGWPTQLAVSP